VTIHNNAKVLRVESFINSLRNPAVRSRLVSYGLTDEILAKGEGSAQTARRLVFDTPPIFLKTDVVDRVGDWEKHWFPIIGASLRFEHPAVHERLFRNIDRGQGEAALPHVLTLAERLLALASSTDAEDQAAFALLGSRGVTEAGAHEIADLIRNGERFTAKSGPPREVRDQAVADAWAFYLVWSEIARTAIKDRALLRRMGFRRNSAALAQETPADAVPTAPAATAPSTQSPAAPAAADGSEVAND
jgi:hypothetical protein